MHFSACDLNVHNATLEASSWVVSLSEINIYQEFSNGIAEYEVHPSILAFGVYPALFLGLVSYAALVLGDALTVLSVVVRFCVGVAHSIHCMTDLAVEASTASTTFLLGKTFQFTRVALFVHILQQVLRASNPLLNEGALVVESLASWMTVQGEVLKTFSNAILASIDDLLFELLYLGQQQFELYSEIVQVEMSSARTFLSGLYDNVVVPGLQSSETYLYEFMPSATELSAKDAMSVLVVASGVAYIVMTLVRMIYSSLVNLNGQKNSETVNMTSEVEMSPVTPVTDRIKGVLVDVSTTTTTTCMTPATTVAIKAETEIPLDEASWNEVNEGKNEDDSREEEPRKNEDDSREEEPRKNEENNKAVMDSKDIAGDNKQDDDQEIEEVSPEDPDSPVPVAVSPQKVLKTRTSLLRGVKNVVDLTNSPLPRNEQDDDGVSDERENHYIGSPQNRVWVSSASETPEALKETLMTQYLRRRREELLVNRPSAGIGGETKKLPTMATFRPLSSRYATSLPIPAPSSTNENSVLSVDRPKLGVALEEINVGMQVTVCNRMIPGVPYKPGGVAKITAINRAAGTVDVKYLVENGRGKGVPIENLVLGIHPEMYGMSSASAVPKAATSSLAPRGFLEDRSNRATVIVPSKRTTATRVSRSLSTNAEQNN